MGERCDVSLVSPTSGRSEQALPRVQEDEGSQVVSFASAGSVIGLVTSAKYRAQLKHTSRRA